MHTSYTVGITTGEYKALQYVMVDQNDYVTFNMGGFSHTNGQAILYASTGNRFFGYLIG